MKKLLLALSAAALVSGCGSGAGQPWSMDPQAEYDAVQAQGPQAATAADMTDDDAAAGDAEGAGDSAYQERQRRAFRRGCELIMRTVWAETDQGRYIIEAESKSEECVDAELSLAIRAPNRRVVYRANLVSSEVYGFTEVTTPLEMRGALIDWATNYGSLTRRTGRLPYWPRGAVNPTVAGAYPMLVDEAWDRVTYLEVRDADLPIYCHILDLESMNCLVLDDEEQDVVQLGVQTFPPRGGQQASANATQ